MTERCIAESNHYCSMDLYPSLNIYLYIYAFIFSMGIWSKFAVIHENPKSNQCAVKEGVGSGKKNCFIGAENDFLR